MYTPKGKTIKEETIMTRFAMELKGELGAFWKKNAEEEIRKMQARADNGEICTTAVGAAYWGSSGNYLPADCAEILTYTDFSFSVEETTKAREAQTAEFIRNYHHEVTEEERAEMRAAFGTGTTVVDVISGKKIKL